MTENEKLAKLMAGASALGTTWRQTSENDLSFGKTLSAGVERAKAEKADHEFSTSSTLGFGTAKFRGASAVAALLAQEFNDSNSPEFATAAGAVVGSFLAAFTNKTAKSDGGGAPAGYVHFISLGNHAETIRVRLQNRLAHWNTLKATAEAMDKGDERKRLLDEANTYLQLRGDCPTESGEWPVGRDGVAKRPKHLGRPKATINGVFIKDSRGGTTREGQLAEIAAVARIKGVDAISDDVIDAFLSNGGKYRDAADESVGQKAQAAANMVQALVTEAGDSPDAVLLATMLTVLSRIARDGFALSMAGRGDVHQGTTLNPVNPLVAAAPEEAEPEEAEPEEAEPEEAEPPHADAAPSVPAKPRKPRKPRGGSL